MSSCKPRLLLALFFAFTASTAFSQTSVDQVSAGDQRNAFVPQVSGGGGAFVPQISGSSSASVLQVPQGARFVAPPQAAPQQARRAARQPVRSAAARRQPAVIGQPSLVSPFPTVGRGTSAIAPARQGVMLPTVGQGAVRL